MGNITENFSRHEFECNPKECGCGFATVDIELVHVLEDLRNHFDKPIRINSACRCVNHNHSVGGSPKSKHLQGIAADIVVEGITPINVYRYLDDKYPDSYGMGSYSSFTHIDVRNAKARW